MENEKKYDVAILGWWYGVNYGSILTYYGLNKAISNLGYDVLMVHETLGYNAWRVRWPETIMPLQFAKRVGYNYTKQYDKSELAELNDLADAFVVGSDQLWNPGIPRVNEDLLLSFVNPNKKRISYGTSISRGEEYFNDLFIKDFRNNVQKFDGVSVREVGALEQIKKYTGVSAEQVVDPVFLLDKADYGVLADQATFEPEGDYLALFLLDPNEDKKRVALAISEKLGFNHIIVIPNPEANISIYENIFAGDQFEILREAAPENFLNIYRHAAYVVTDSFHGSVFSAVFEKPFNSFFNVTRGAQRFTELMDLLALGDSRQVFEDMTSEAVQNSDNVTRTIAYGDKITFNQKRQQSLAWLQNVLTANHAVDFETFMTTHEFVFYRTGSRQKPLARHVVFDKYGVISGINSPNERYWRFEDNQFIILNAKNEPTSVFDILPDVLSEETFKISGDFVVNPEVKHIFETETSYNAQHAG
ncbi:polysaccharide pyruvyl transferase family protein [Lactococcus insecticola]|uniref:Polysaccharide pyruvyl transferase domain-containing protein n=1 Tax=Pseudolactococcus insecticola TaxID=2709158 RepID=A0A6A0B3S2_9LACT|nr:polysaccharide pyruvyl transferase family protein [Lactococcus insecticola]GFH39802.1 hypothetical protein Hs20B_02000 [Lactococcus insecticola]